MVCRMVSARTCGVDCCIVGLLSLFWLRWQVRRLKAVIEKLEREFEKTQQKVGLKMKLLDADKDGVIHIDEVLRAVNLIAGENSEEVIKQVRKRHFLRSARSFGRKKKASTR